MAEVYELDKPVGSAFPGLKYYTRQLAGVTGRILEPATGTGRVLVPLLEAGFTVDGLDISPDMLAVCRQRCRDRGLDPVLREADMTKLTRPAPWPACFTLHGCRSHAVPATWLRQPCSTALPGVVLRG